MADAQDGLRAGLVSLGGEVEVPLRVEGPAGEDVGERQHVVLGVAADAQGVQLQDLPGQALVEPAPRRLPVMESGPMERRLPR